MKKDNITEAARLRQKAEDKLTLKSVQPDMHFALSDLQTLVHELQVHQVELEMQNEELKRAKNESESARGKFTELYDFAPAGYFTLNDEGLIIQLNLRASQIVGKDRSSLINSRLGVFISDDTKHVFNTFLDQVFKSTIQKSCEITFSWNGKEPLVAQLNGIISGNGNLCLVTAIDITARKHAEEATMESERFLREVQIIAQHGTFSIDIEHGLWEGSEVLYTILGIDNKYDKTLAGWISIVHPDWREKVKDYFHSSVVRNFKFDMEHQLIRQNDKSERWVHAVGRLDVDEFNQPKKIIGILGDITEHKLAEESVRESEEKYRMLLELATDAFFHGNEQGDFILVNSNAIEITGFSKEELLKMNMKDLFSMETLQIQPLKYEQARRGEIIHTERELIRMDGTKIFVDMNSRVMPDGTFQSFMRDITERKRIENELKQKLFEMEIYYELAITRERKMIALKSEINLLLGRLGEKLKY